jgi:hypothetical protein
MTLWSRRVLFIAVLIGLSTQSFAGMGEADCAPDHLSQSGSQHPCCDPDPDSNPDFSCTPQCDHCPGYPGQGVLSAGCSMPFAALAGQVLGNPASQFPANPYYRLLRPPRG